MNSASKREDISALFSDEESEPKTKTRNSRPPPPDASPEFQQLIETMNRKVERRRAKPKTIAASIFNRARHDVDQMIASRDWEGCGARHLVALYDMMHLKCYGVEAAELGPTERYNASMMAANFVKREFDGDYVEAVKYMRWAWTREMKTEKWCREVGKTDRRRLGIRLMFGGFLLTDYRIALARTAHRA